jgi:hypothetical protein
MSVFLVFGRIEPAYRDQNILKGKECSAKLIEVSAAAQKNLVKDCRTSGTAVRQPVVFKRYLLAISKISNRCHFDPAVSGEKSEF